MNNISNYKEIFSILTLILMMITTSEKLSPSYAVSINYNQLTSGHLHDNMKRNVDDNAFSNLSRNLTSTTNANFGTGDRNSNSPNNIGRGGTSGNGISSSIFRQDGYQLTVNVSPYPFGTVAISITTANGYTDQANVATAGVSSWTFNIPPNQGNWVRACVNSENSSGENCNTYNTTGTDMSVSLSPVSDNNNGNPIYRSGNHGFGGFSGNHVGGNHGFGEPGDHLH
jgi:hypothetical protein